MAARLTDSMDIVKMRMEDIHPYQNNPRKNNQAVEAVAESIRQCGYVAPIIVDEDNVILAGHTRYKALKQLCYTEAEVVVKAGLSEEQKRKYRLLDNKTNELAEWDYDLLEEELDGLDFGELDLDWGGSPKRAGSCRGQLRAKIAGCSKKQDGANLPTRQTPPYVWGQHKPE